MRVGITSLTEAEAQALVGDLIGRPVGFAELAEGAERLSRRLWRKGSVARVYFPEQALDSGVLRIAVAEARLESVKVTTPTAPQTDGEGAAKLPSGSERAGTARAERMIRRAGAQGATLDLDGLRRALLLANDLPGMKANMSVAPGSSPGTSSLGVDLSARSGTSGYASYANHGARATGNDQLLGSFSFWPGNGGRYDVVGLVTERSRYASLAGSWALGLDGIRLSLEASALDYSIANRDLAALDARGNAYAAEARAVWPVVRSDYHNLYLTGSVRYRRLTDDALGARVRARDIVTGSLDLSGDLVLGDAGLSGAGSPALQYGLRAVFGNVSLGVPADRAADLAGEQTQGGFAKFVGRLGGLVPLDHRTTLNVSATAQFATQNLDGSEEFFLGGPYAVRAYPLGEGSGDEGLLGTIELRHRLANTGSAQIELNGFVDQGQIWRKAQPQLGVPSGRQSYGLTSAGVGVRVQWQRWQVEAIGAATVGKNAGAAAAGGNQDGSASGTRGWIRLTRFFGG